MKCFEDAYDGHVLTRKYILILLFLLLCDGRIDGSGSVLKRIVAGRHHTCVILSLNSIKCWGNNSIGQIGDGTQQNSTKPVKVASINTEYVALTAGGNHTCALESSGVVQCWGDNSDGRLGNGTTKNSLVPVSVIGLQEKVVSVSAGYSHTCALLSSGKVKCWGWNGDRQLGHDTGYTSPNPVPVDVIGLDGRIVAISAGGAHTCALDEDGAIKCWGLNKIGQLGDGTLKKTFKPVVVAGLSEPATEISAGYDHTCALMSSGAVRCWGSNGNGELGNGRLTYSKKPVDVVGLGNRANFVFAGYNYTCAITLTDAVLCWGNIDWGRPTHRYISVPAPVEKLEAGVISLAGGDGHVCVLFPSDIIKCWGYNADGQLGNGNTSTKDSPVPYEVFAE